MRETFPRRCLQCTVGLHPNYMGHLDNIVKTNKALIQMEDEFLDTDQSQDSDYSQDSFVVSDGHIS